MAYNLESFVKLLKQILTPDDHHHQPWILDPAQRPQIESLLEKARFVEELFKDSSQVTSDEVQSLESRIRDAVYDAEDAIESHLSSQLLSRTNGERSVISPPDLLKVIGELDIVKEEMTKIMDRIQERGTVSSSIPISSTQNLNPKNIVVGMSKELGELMDRLTGRKREREIIPIVGIGGIGKTTLVRSLYDNPLVVSHFDICAWVAISQSYDVKNILLDLLQCVKGKLRDEKIKENTNELSSQLYKVLRNRRYLIVIDDLWDTKAWDDIGGFFPNDNNRSRIVVTTRGQEVAKYVDPHNAHHQMIFLNDFESWNLLCKKVFGEETCPEDLKEVGKTIAIGCRGLPLAIHVVGGVLSQLEETKESWMQVAKDVGSTVTSKDEFSNILSLSYNHLPNHLKPCFLYLNVFPEDHMIQASKLINLWIA